MLRPQHDRGGRAELGIRDRDNDAARGACYEGDEVQSCARMRWTDGGLVASCRCVFWRPPSESSKVSGYQERGAGRSATKCAATTVIRCWERRRHCTRLPGGAGESVCV
jgi:hypothetical protein